MGDKIPFDPDIMVLYNIRKVLEQKGEYHASAIYISSADSGSGDEPGKGPRLYLQWAYNFQGNSLCKGFHAPEPVEPWDGVLDATSYGYVCPLLEMPKPNGELLVPHRYWIMSEDCQNLNIWTPACDDGARPVMVWLHGGGYEAGSAIEQTAYEGENMCRRGEVVVVSVNHRLNVLGYCDLSSFGEEYVNSGNAGTEDLVAALRWVHENIARFGGDPENVILFGQSGGGAKVTTLLQTPAADGLYAKGINMSGVTGPLLADSVGSGEELGRAMMEELGIRSVKELEEVPYDALAAAYQKVRPALAAAGKNAGGTPHPNEFYVGEPGVHGFRRETAHIPMLVGTVYGEFTSFVPGLVDVHDMSEEERIELVKGILRKGMETTDNDGSGCGDGCKAGTENTAIERMLTLFRRAYPDRHPAQLPLLDFTFRLPAQEYIRERSALNRCTWSYLFNLDLPVDGGRTPWHCADIPYVFCNTELVPVTWEDGVTERVEAEVFGAVMAFARTGDPNHDGIPAWKPSAPGEEWTLIIDKKTEVRCNHDAELIPLYAKYMGPIFARNWEQEKESVAH